MTAPEGWRLIDGWWHKVDGHTIDRRRFTAPIDFTHGCGHSLTMPDALGVERCSYCQKVIK